MIGERQRRTRLLEADRCLPCQSAAKWLDSVAARISRTVIMPVRDTVAIAVAVNAVGDTIVVTVSTVTIAVISRAPPIRNLVSYASGQQSHGGNQQNKKLFHNSPK